MNAGRKGHAPQTPANVPSPSFEDPLKQSQKVLLRLDLRQQRPFIRFIGLSVFDGRRRLLDAFVDLFG